MTVALLQKLNQRIALETRLIGEQKERIKELKREEHETAEAEEVLDALEETLEDTMTERDTALRAIEVQCLADDGEPPLRDTDGPFGGIPAGARKFLDLLASSGLQ
jgi:hypothetical protein